MVSILGIDRKSNSFYFSVLFITFTIYAIKFWQTDLAYIFVGRRFQPTAENLLSLLSLISIIFSMIAFVVFFIKVKIRMAYYQFYSSFIIIGTFISIIFHITLTVILFAYSAGKPTSAIALILLESAVFLSGFVLLIYLHYHLKRAFDSRKNFCYDLKVEQHDENHVEKNFELQD